MGMHTHTNNFNINSFRAAPRVERKSTQKATHCKGGREGVTELCINKSVPATAMDQIIKAYSIRTIRLHENQMYTVYTPFIQCAIVAIHSKINGPPSLIFI